MHFLKHCCHKLSVPPSVFLPIYHPKMVMHAFRMSARRPISKMVYSVYGQRTNHGKKMCESGDKISNQLMYKNALNIHCKCTFSRTHTFDFTLSRLLIWVNFCWQMSHMRQVLSLSDSSKCCLSWSSLLKRSVHCPTVSLQVCTSVSINMKLLFSLPLLCTLRVWWCKWLRLFERFSTHRILLQFLSRV